MHTCIRGALRSGVLNVPSAACLSFGAAFWGVALSVKCPCAERLLPVLDVRVCAGV